MIALAAGARIDRAYGFQRHVVIKRPLEHLREDPRAALSLRREATIGARLRHPNLVAILDAGEHDREGTDHHHHTHPPGLHPVTRNAAEDPRHCYKFAAY